MPSNSDTAKSIAKASGLVLLVLILIIGGCGFLLSSLFSDLCGNEIFQEVYSPGKAYKAVVFQRDCGATTGFTTHVSILKASATLPNLAGNVVALNGHPDSTKVSINWETNRLVSIRHSGAYKVLAKNDTIWILLNRISVEYKTASE
jgi:hypothetical protein